MLQFISFVTFMVLFNFDLVKYDGMAYYSTYILVIVGDRGIWG